MNLLNCCYAVDFYRWNYALAEKLTVPSTKSAHCSYENSFIQTHLSPCTIPKHQQLYLSTKYRCCSSVSTEFHSVILPKDQFCLTQEFALSGPSMSIYLYHRDHSSLELHGADPNPWSMRTLLGLERVDWTYALNNPVYSYTLFCRARFTINRQHAIFSSEMSSINSCFNLQDETRQGQGRHLGNSRMFSALYSSLGLKRHILVKHPHFLGHRSSDDCIFHHFSTTEWKNCPSPDG